MSTGFRFLKGHGTHNDFVVLPDPDGTVHGDLAADVVRAVCDRRGGIGGDGVLRAIKVAAAKGDNTWFMDYRNADGSVAEMCGNGIRVFARYLVDHEKATSPLAIDTRAGRKSVIVDGDTITADLGSPEALGDTRILVADQSLPATHISMGNPHAVAFVDDLTALDLSVPPGLDETVFPDGVNAEFVVRRGERHVAMRVYERGVGETQSCGTGAGAVMVAAALRDQVGRGATYRVDVPGGTLMVTWTTDDRILLAGPAVLVAEGYWLA